MEKIQEGSGGELSSEDSMETITINIKCLGIKSNHRPYFFLKYSTADKRYRVSTSFKYINIKYGLHINIVRDFKKVRINGFELTNADKILFILELLNNHASCSEYIVADTAVDQIKYTSFLDINQKTEIFLINRTFEMDSNTTIVFFSAKWWSLSEYLDDLANTKSDVDKLNNMNHKGDTNG